MANLTIGYWIFTLIGIVSTAITTVLCVYIFKKYTLEQRTWKKLEYQLILLRVVFDGINNFICCFYFLSTIFTLQYPDIIPFHVSFLIGISASNFLEMRSFLAAIIAIERVMATFIPLHFYNYRKRVSNVPIIMFVVSTGIACDVVLFGIYGLKLPFDAGCMSINCAIPPGYQSYTFTTRMIYSSINILFSGILCIKLLSLSLKHTSVPIDLRNPNLLSLTDGLSTLSFDLIPSLIFSYGILDSKSLGPVVGVLRQIGRGVEAVVMMKLMKKTTTVQPSKTEE